MTISAHGIAGMLVYWLLAIGAGVILLHLENWLRERVTIDLHPLWRVIPRRLRVGLRWDRPGAMVCFADGREGCVLRIFDMDDSPGPVALVQPYGENDDPENQRPGWVELSALTPLPRRSLRETWREIRGTGGGAQ